MPTYKDFFDVEAMRKFGFKKGTIINVESIPFNDKPHINFYRVWYWG